MASYPQTADQAARQIVSRLTPVQKHELAVAAVKVGLADQHSLSDPVHHDHVHGIVTGAAPKLGAALRQLIAKVRITREEPVHRPR